MGVLGRRGLTTAAGTVDADTSSLAALGAVAGGLGLLEVWVHEEAIEAAGWPLELGRLEPWDGRPHPFTDAAGPFETSLRRPGLSHYARYRAPSGHAFALHVPAWAARRGRSPFAGTAGPAELLEALSLYEEATGGRWGWRGNGAQTSEAWLRRRYAQRGKVAPSQVAPPFDAGLAGEYDLQWHRTALGAEEKDAAWLVAFDVNAQYLGAASTLALPSGALEHRDLFPTLAETVPGYWLFDPPAWEGRGPCPWPRRDPCWVTTPTACYLAKVHNLAPLEAWVWPEHHQYLRPWYEQLRDAREVALGVGGPALEAVKGIYKAGLGRLESRNRSGGLEGAALYQPYWGQAVTALARCNLLRRLAKIDAAPVGINVDCLYFFTDRDPHAFAARAGIPLGDGLGQFKLKGRVRAMTARTILANGGAYADRLERRVGVVAGWDEALQ